ncbi:FRS2 family protein [Megaselia abdita]
MGCINSHSQSEKVFYRVTDSRFGEGKLEINSDELIFHKRGCSPIVWSLKHLRRYGVDPDTEIFSFEAGRRCTTGEGIYAFKCPQANDVFEELRDHIEGIATSNSVEDILQSNNFPSSPDHLDESLHTLRPRKPPTQPSQIDGESDYLEPQPSVQTTTLMHPRAFQIRMMSVTGNMSPDIESSDSLHSIPEFSEQISESPLALAHDNNNSHDLEKDNIMLSPGTAGLYINVSTILSPNINKSITTTPKSVKSIFFDETIPRNYVNVDIPDSKSDFIQQQPNEEDPILSATTIEISDENATTMNYIVLDLGQEKDNTHTMSTSTLTSGCATTTNFNNSTKVISSSTTTPPSHVLTKSLSTGSGISFNSLSGGTTLMSPESPKTEPFSYATIDFQKTIALASSTNNNVGNHTLEGVRKTRHDSYGMK